MAHTTLEIQPVEAKKRKVGSLWHIGVPRPDYLRTKLWKIFVPQMAFFPPKNIATVPGGIQFIPRAVTLTRTSCANCNIEVSRKKQLILVTWQGHSDTRWTSTDWASKTIGQVLCRSAISREIKLCPNYLKYWTKTKCDKILLGNQEVTLYCHSLSVDIKK